MTAKKGAAMKTGLMTAVTNAVSRRKYFVSTIEGPAGWQTAVFQKKFGPFANFKKPEFVLGGSTTERAADQHDRTIAIVRDLDPAGWADASQKLAVQAIEEWAASEKPKDDAFYEELLRHTNSEQQAMILARRAAETEVQSGKSCAVCAISSAQWVTNLSSTSTRAFTSDTSPSQIKFSPSRLIWKSRLSARFRRRS